MINTRTNIHRMEMFLSIVLFIFACIIFVYIYGKIKENNQKAESEMVSWQVETERRNDITSLNDSLGQISSDRDLLGTHFAQSSDVVPFLNTIEQLSPPGGAKVEVDSVEAGTNNTGLTVELKASGSFEQVYKFLTLLENSPYELNFIAVDMHTATTSWEATFKIQLLSFIP